MYHLLDESSPDIQIQTHLNEKKLNDQMHHPFSGVHPMLKAERDSLGPSTLPSLCVPFVQMFVCLFVLVVTECC